MMTIGAKTMSARTRGSNPSEVLCGGLTSARECHVPRKRKTKVKSLARSNLVLHHKDCQIRVSLRLRLDEYANELSIHDYETSKTHYTD